MGLNDLMNEIKQDPNNFLGDEATENKVLRQVMALVEDKISEVKNQAVKWYVPSDFPDLRSLCLSVLSLGQLIKIIRESQMDFVVDKLIDFSSNKDEELRDISSLGSAFCPVSSILLTVQSPQIFHNSPQDDHSGASPRKPNRTESLR